MIHIVIENETIGGIQHDLQKLLEGVSAKTPQGFMDDIPEVTVKTKPAPKKEALPVAEPIVEDVQQIEEPVESFDEQPTMEETRAKLNELRGKKGSKALRAILSEHGVSSFTDLKPDEYAAVIAEADAAM